MSPCGGASISVDCHASPLSLRSLLRSEPRDYDAQRLAGRSGLAHAPSATANQVEL